MSNFNKIIHLAVIAMLVTIISGTSPPKQEILIDINADGSTDKILVSEEDINFYTAGADTTFVHKYQIEHKTRKVFKYKQTDLNGPNVDVDPNGTRLLSFEVKEDINSLYKYLIADINLDGLKDLIIIRPDILHWSYIHDVYLQKINGVFPTGPDFKVVTRGSSWLTGIYRDINADGLPDKIDISYQQKGLYLNKNECNLKVYLLNKDNNLYDTSPYVHIVERGVIDDKISFKDVNNDRFTDIIFIDVPSGYYSISKIFSSVIRKKIKILIKVYCFNSESGYPNTPSFTSKMPINISEEFEIFLDTDINNDGYSDLQIKQKTTSKFYLYDPLKPGYK